MTLTAEQERRFWSHTRRSDIVHRNVDTPCIEWHGAISKSQRGEGYGNVKINGRNFKAHVIGFLILNGRMPQNGNVVMHMCDNRRCVYHLEEGTQSDNMFDMHRKRRGYVPTGESNPGSKLNEEIVRDIRVNASLGSSDAEQAERYNVTRNTIKRIVEGKAWRHVIINVNISENVDELTLNVDVDEEAE